MTTETEPKCKLISHAALRFLYLPYEMEAKSAHRGQQKREPALKKMKKNEQSLKTNFHKTIFRSPTWQTMRTLARRQAPRPLQSSTAALAASLGNLNLKLNVNVDTNANANPSLN